MDAIKNWLKNNYVGLTAGVIAVIALSAAVKSCNGNNAVSERVDGVEATVDTLGMVQQTIIETLNNHEGRITSNLREINALKNRMSAVEDSIDVHRAEIDSLKLRVDTVEMRTDSLAGRVDTIAKRQEKCPCINPKQTKKSEKRPARPNNVPVVKPDTVVLVVKETPVKPAQQANGCGDDQNANVVIHGNNNTVTISNNGGKSAADTTKTTTRRVIATATSTLTVNTYVTRQSYCK